MNIDNVIKEIYREHYEMHRGELHDFPSEEKWIAQQLTQFKRNNPELLGYTYDESSNDWIKEEGECPCGMHKYGGYHRMPNNKD